MLGVRGIGLVQPGRHFGGQLRLLLHHVLIAHRPMLARVGPQLGAIHDYVTELDQT